MALPAERRLRRSSDITAVLRQGRRARSGGLVVHARPRGGTADGAGPRVAFVAPRTVGTAVVRNRTRRRLQGLVLDLERDGVLRDDVDLVLRLLPDSGTATTVQLRRALGAALDRLGLGGRGRR